MFQATRDADFALFAIDPRGGAPVRLAETDGPGFGPPIPSPDGTKVILPGQGALRILDASGTRRLATGAPDTAAWSPDGERIVFVGLSRGLSVIDADGRNGRRLTRDWSDGEAAWSPDGERIAFTRSDVGVVVVRADGSGERVLARARAGELHWAEDGESLSFVAYDADFALGELLSVDAESGRTLRRVPRVDVHPVRSIAWSPDGRRLAFERWIIGRVPRSEVVLLNADGSARRRVSPRGEDAYDPVWSPEGGSLVYTQPDELGGSELWSVRADGTGRRRLTRVHPDGVSPLSPAWARVPLVEEPSPYRLVASRRADGAVLRLPVPVASLAAAGTRVAVVSPERIWGASWQTTPPLVVWNGRSRAARPISLAGCDEPEVVAVLDDRIALDCPQGTHASFGRSVRVFPPGRTRPFDLAVGHAGDGYPVQPVPGRTAGAGRLLVFSTATEGRSPQLWRALGRERRLVVSGVDAVEPTAVDRGRIVVEREDGRIAILTASGRLVGRLEPGARPPRPTGRLPEATAALAGDDLVVLRGGRLRLYDARSLRLRRAWQVDRGARLAGTAAGLVAYVDGADVHVLRVRDGRETVVRSGSRAVVPAQLTRAGLFYAVHPKPLPEHDLWPFEENPARVVFLERAALLRRLG